MKENFFASMVMEGGKISHKRVISVGIAVVLAWSIIYSILKANGASDRIAIIHATMIFIGVMSGVATVAQIVSLVRGTPPPKDDETKTP